MSTVTPSDWITIGNDYVDPEKDSTHQQNSDALLKVAELFGEPSAYT